MKLNGFDRIASVYDQLAKLVFGNSIKQAQVYFLNDIPSQSKVLILGGGTGWFLQHLLVLRPDSEVWYIEASLKMLELSKNTTNNSSHVHFIHGTEDNLPMGVQFDVVITNFYFDLFMEVQLDLILERIHTALKPSSIWLVTDFVAGKKEWQEGMLKVMYIFFRLTCQIESSKLPNWNQQLAKKSWVKSSSKYFYRKFIEATVYRL